VQNTRNLTIKRPFVCLTVAKPVPRSWNTQYIKSRFTLQLERQRQVWYITSINKRVETSKTLWSVDKTCHTRVHLWWDCLIKRCYIKCSLPIGLRLIVIQCSFDCIYVYVYLFAHETSDITIRCTANEPDSKARTSAISCSSRQCNICHEDD